MNKKLKLFCQSILDITASNFPNEDLNRIKENINNLLKGPDNNIVSRFPLQKPTFHYYAGLRDQPWWEIEFMATNELMVFKEKIRTELKSVLFKNQFSEFSLSVTEAYPPAYLEGEMNTYHLVRDFDPDQKKYKKIQLELPQTMEFLRFIPRLADDVFFSCLVPGTHLKAHEAEDNVRLNVHLGLEVPKGCGISVANQQRTWPEDQLLCFDPSFTHEAWNLGSYNRHILLFTIWHPDLTKPEIFFLKLFGKDYHHYL